MEKALSAEEQRLSVLKSYDLLDTPPEERFDRITRLAAHVFGVPVAIVSLVDACRQWFKSKHGTDLKETPREISFCEHTIVSNSLLVLEDLQQDERFAENPFVTEYGYRFYAGAPLISEDGYALGALCILDVKPRKLSADERNLLTDMAAMVTSELESTRRAKQAVDKALRLSEMETRFSNLVRYGTEAISILDKDGNRVYQSPSVANVLGYTAEELEGTNAFDTVHPDDQEHIRDLFTGFVAGGEHGHAEMRIRHKDGTWRWVALTATNLLNDPSVAGIVINTRDITASKEQSILLEQRDRLLQMAAKVAEVLTTETEFPSAVHQAFLLIAEATGADRVYMFENHRRPETGELLTSQRFEWSGAAVEPQIDNADLQSLPVESIVATWSDTLRRGEAVADLVRNAPASLRPMLESQGILSILQVPIVIDGAWAGTIGLDDCTTERMWTHAEKMVLSTIANTMGSVFKIKRSEQRFRSFVSATSQVIWTADEQGSISELSSAWSSFTGQSKMEFWAEAIHPEDVAQVLATWEHHIAQKIPCEIEYRLRRYDGVYQWFYVTALPLFDDQGRFVEWFGTCTNVDDQKKAEAALQASEERYRTIINTAHEGVWMIDAQSETTFANQRMADMLGYSLEEMLRLHVMDVVPEDKRETEREHMERRRQGISDSHESLIRRKNGEDLWAIVSASPILTSEGAYAGAVALITDITDRKHSEETLLEAKEQAEEMSRLKSAFLANMSHEIRTPLTSIIGFSDILAEEAPEEMQPLAQMIRSSGERLMMTLDSVMDLAQLESKSLKLAPMMLDVVQEVVDLLPMFERQAQARGLSLSVEHDEPRIQALLDKGAFVRVLTNLLGNAMKFTNDGGVTVRLKRRKGTLTVEVADTGIGIGSEFIPRLFDEFKQESEGMSRAYEGVGLGLSITKRLVDLMSGTIEVQSERGRGTIFTIHLPIGTPGSAIEAGETPEEQARAERHKVLAVEDRDDARLLLDVLLRDRYDVTLTSNAEEALAASSRERYDAVIMDINLGAGMTGKEALRELRKQAAYEKVPVIACTAFALPGDRERLMEDGFDAYIGKPFRKRALLDLLDTLIAADHTAS